MLGKRGAILGDELIELVPAGGQLRVGALDEGVTLVGVAVGAEGKAEACMGIASTDIDGNGLPDIFITNFETETNTLYANMGNRIFDDQTETMELARSSYTMMGWGTQFLDLNDDDQPDLVLLNGHLHQRRMAAQIFLMDKGRFRTPSSYDGDYFNEEWLGRALAIADLNNDARPDLIATHRTGRPHVLINESGSRRRMKLRLVATASHRNALGTRVALTSGSHSISHTLSTEGGYLTANESAVWLTLPESGSVDSLTIQWPSGHKQTLKNVDIGGTSVVVESPGDDVRLVGIPD